MGFVRLPAYAIAVRWDGCSDDYTGLGQPGVWHLEPQQDSWDFPLAKVYTINHPNAARPVKRCEESDGGGHSRWVRTCSRAGRHFPEYPKPNR